MQQADSNGATIITQNVWINQQSNLWHVTCSTLHCLLMPVCPSTLGKYSIFESSVETICMPILLEEKKYKIFFKDSDCFCLYTPNKLKL